MQPAPIAGASEGVQKALGQEPGAAARCPGTPPKPPARHARGPRPEARPHHRRGRYLVECVADDLDVHLIKVLL